MSKETKSYELKDHQLFGSSWRLWRRLKRENEIHPSKKRLTRKISIFILFLTPFRLLQRALLSRRLRNPKLKDDAPIFVIGHWRSGTTHLHYLLAQDDRFATLGAFQGFFFNVAFTAKWLFKPILKRAMPKTRPQDNVKINPEAPTEDEHALVNMSEKSGMHLFFFPKNRTYFDRYNCFEGISPEDLKDWKRHFTRMLKQIEMFNAPNKKLLLKNPHSTARIKMLSEMYPNAKFVFIHRNPYDVFQSMQTLYAKSVRTQFLQEFSEDDLNELILYCYEKLMKNYINCRNNIPESRWIEVAFSDLEKQPIVELKRIYTHLDLGAFDKLQPKLEIYLESLRNYKRNPSMEMDAKMQSEIEHRWDFAFKEWNYKK